MNAAAIRIGGDDSWDTYARVVDALTGFHVEVEGLTGTWELRGTTDHGAVMLQFITPEGERGDYIALDGPVNFTTL